jgi:hypothetical protein
MKEIAYLFDARNRKPMGNQPLQFVRVPAIGEYVQLPNAIWTVQAVCHVWSPNGEPVVELLLAPPQ